MWTQLTLKSDSTFEFVHIYMGEQKEKGRWRKYSDILILTECNSCGVIIDPIKLNGHSKIIIPKRTFEYKYISIKGDSLYIVKPFGIVDMTTKLIKRKK